MGLDSVELLIDVEKEFDITIDDSEAKTLFTVGDLHRCVVRKLDPRMAESVSTNVWNRLCRILMESFVISEDQITPEARIVNDLGIN